MYLIPTLNTQEEVLTVLNKIQLCDESGATGNISSIKCNFINLQITIIIYINIKYLFII